MLQFIYLIAIAIYLFASIFPQAMALNHLLSISCLLAVLMSLHRARGLALFFSLSFLSGGLFLLAASKSAPFNYLLSFGNMIQMVTLFALVPILAIPVRCGNYAQEVSCLINLRIRNQGQLYRLTSLLSYFFSSFMNLAALPMAYYAIDGADRVSQLGNKNQFFSRSMTHGYAMPLLWSPITPIVGTVLLLTGTRYTTILPLLVLLSICGLLIDWSLAGSATPLATAAWPDRPVRNHPWRLLHLLLATLLLNLLVVLLDHAVSLSFLLLVSFLVLPFAFAWSLLLGKTRPFLSAVQEHFRVYPIKMSNQFLIFLSAGFFMTTLHVSHADVLITGWVSQLIAYTGFRFFLVLLPLIPFSLAFLGLHPAIGLALVAGALQADLLNQAPIAVTIAMLGGAIPAFLMGPYNATLGMMGGLIDEQPLVLSRWNLPFTAAYLLFLTIFVQVLYVRL
ncbi:hypothetical protein [Sporolactobacillus spathodeae]|uniref:Uncharacterized protein n=1 Tax=Sporolactobacillus spathodeae TaxID=1465502 RepID=A0ABS2Q5C8_9BACL|nr:hypothetical protein [Sporolactobacillus spathodeae]MBM7656896.1 hypothetical protein [Sporolactobacillus spathodeae]